MGFLQSVFERFIPDNILIAEELERRGVTENGAYCLAEAVSSFSSRPSAFVFDAESAAFRGQKSIASKAFDYLQNKTGGRVYAAFELKRASFDDKDAPVIKAPAFSANRIAVRDCVFSEQNLRNFIGGLYKTGAVTLEIENTPCTGCLDSLNAPEGLSDLSVKNVRTNASDMAALTAKITHLPLKRLALREETPDAAGLEAMIKAIPASVSVLNLSGCPLNGGSVDALASKMADLKKAEIIDLSECGLNADNVEKLANALPPSVRKFNLDGADISDGALRALLKSARRPDSMLCETNIVPRVTSVADPDPRYTQSLGADLTMAECDNKHKYIKGLAKEKAALIAEKTAATRNKTLTADVLARRNEREY